MRRLFLSVTAAVLLTQGAARGGAGAREPAWSPDGKRVAVSWLDRIWTLAPDGRDARPLDLPFDSQVARAQSRDRLHYNASGFAEREPAWSPDGSRIAYASDREGTFDIYSAPVNGGTPTRLTSLPGDERWPSWTRDGRIVFSYRHDGNWDLYAVSDGLRPAPPQSLPRHSTGFPLLKTTSSRGVCRQTARAWPSSAIATAMTASWTCGSSNWRPVKRRSPSTRSERRDPPRSRAFGETSTGRGGRRTAHESPTTPSGKGSARSGCRRSTLEARGVTPFTRVLHRAPSSRRVTAVSRLVAGRPDHSDRRGPRSRTDLQRQPAPKRRRAAAAFRGGSVRPLVGRGAARHSRH